MNNKPQPIAGVRYPAQTKSFLNGLLMKPHAANILPVAADRIDWHVCSWRLSPGGLSNQRSAVGRPRPAAMTPLREIA